jgi:hypothetical protein
VTIQTRFVIDFRILRSGRRLKDGEKHCKKNKKCCSKKETFGGLHHHLLQDEFAGVDIEGKVLAQ